MNLEKEDNHVFSLPVVCLSQMTVVAFTPKQHGFNIHLSTYMSVVRFSMSALWLK